MSDDNNAGVDVLAQRWDKVSYAAQGSPFEDLAVASIARNSGTRPWMRVNGSKDHDTVGRYVYLTFRELLEIEGLDLRQARQLLEIMEATFSFDSQCEVIGSFDAIDDQAMAQRMRFVNEYGLYRDFPVQLCNLEIETRELCRIEEIDTLVELMEFIDRLCDNSVLGGSFKDLQSIFAHGDESGLSHFLPYRSGYRGFHLAEALSFCLARLPLSQRKEIEEYHERRRRRGRGVRKVNLPAVIEQRVLPEVFQCLLYFGQRQHRLIVRIHDSVYLCRELMHLHDPQTEGILQWLVHLALALFDLQAEPEVVEEAGLLDLSKEADLMQELREMIRESEQIG